MNLDQVISSGGFMSPDDFKKEQSKDCEFEYFNTDPCPDFIDLLPDQIIDPNTGEVIGLSQSKIKSIRKLAMGELCPKQFYMVDLTREIQLEKKVMAMGSRFEYELTGAPDLDGSIPPEVLTSTGKVGADQKRITENAETGKQTLIRLGVDLDEAEVQAQVNFKCLSSNMDLVQISNDGAIWYIDDVKYSGVIGSNWSPYSWTPENLASQFDMQAQARQYTLLALLSGAEKVRFRYIVFDNRASHEGEYAVFQLELSEEAINAHKWVILKSIEQLQLRFDGLGFDAIPSYERCKQCPIKCSQMKKYPEVNVVKI